MANRIYFANQQIAFRRDNSTTYTVAHGVQSAAVTTTFNLEQAFELGQLAIYENIEGVPDIEISLTKVLDGYPLLYHLATDDDGTLVTGPSLAGRSNGKCLVTLGIWPDSEDAAGDATTTPITQMEASGMFASSISYNFPLEDNFTEDVTVVGNNKAWYNTSDVQNIVGDKACASPTWSGLVASGGFSGNSDGPKATGVNTPWGPTGVEGIGEVSQNGGVNRRENLYFSPTTEKLIAPATGFDYTRLPAQIPSVDTNGWINTRADGNEAHVQSITVSCDLGREELFELGTRQPYARVVTFPIEVTCDIEMLSLSGDLINALADGCVAGTDPCTDIQDNLSNEVIRIATCEGTRIYLGNKNKLASINYGGGDAGGGNVTVTYSYTTFNDFTVLHPQDPTSQSSGWWETRSGYLQTLDSAGALVAG